jgi:predicted site-specific integrase-resolvase
MVRLENAAAQLGITLETVERWAELGLLDIQVRTPPGERLVDEEQLHDVAESMGWLKLSQECLGADW